jgi:hypothetical protein
VAKSDLAARAALYPKIARLIFTELDHDERDLLETLLLDANDVPVSPRETLLALVEDADHSGLYGQLDRLDSWHDPVAWRILTRVRAAVARLEARLGKNSLAFSRREVRREDMAAWMARRVVDAKAGGVELTEDKTVAECLEVFGTDHGNKALATKLFRSDITAGVRVMRGRPKKRRSFRRI